MKYFGKKIAALAISLLIASSSLPAVFANEDNQSNVTINNELEYNGDNYSDSSNDQENNSEDEDSFSIKMQVGTVSSDGKLETPDDLSFEDRLDMKYAKQSTIANIIYGKNRIHTAVKVSRQGWTNGADTVVIVNSNNTLHGIIATPLATTYNAPILITNYNSLDAKVIAELKRLSPKKVILVGDRTLISKAVSDKIKRDTGANMERIFGTRSSDLSLAIAKRISSSRKINTAFVVSDTNGVADALTISSKAGAAKEPILVVSKNYMGTNTYNYLKSNVSNVYYVGGTSSISNAIISKINSVVDNAGNSNRISGKNRHETNINVINKFYKMTNFSTLIVTKSDNVGLIDTVCAGPFAALFGAPIVITPKEVVTNTTKAFLNTKTSKEIYQIGGGILPSVTSDIKNRLSNVYDANHNINSGNKPKQNPGSEIGKIIGKGIKGKIIVIDPGHGAQDSGGVGINGIKEKDWTLKTALACADYLKNAGATVVMTRKTDTYPTLQDRADISNNNKAVFFCSIHYNKGGNVVNEQTGELSGNGAEVFVGEGSGAYAVGKNVLNSILNAFNLRNRGVKNGTHLYVIRNTNAPAILVEGGFVSSSKDVALLNSDAALRKMGIQIAKGIVASFNQQVIK
ncbi:N-acetylmuramoyl-L-alanine amidase [Peptostreptococcus canis]|uniref:N-acetylmuramoyl-L-alanine amidase n=1 Tax=Peptostreptococcus canis TaxID=1159213 RepID=A0ABR6TKP8_9FIRM|nr:N-acetylmuramoyl-L-alanine amidase [Peptostreptococcus canis]MBC2575987.1 N-acetylmuramoyl-L-alanine amidase [Peptostreptococcus canis]MBP1997889.1 N-acetylmuramoyl-L-alanine amidase [Peptostreptococcus canis]